MRFGCKIKKRKSYSVKAVKKWKSFPAKLMVIRYGEVCYQTINGINVLPIRNETIKTAVCPLCCKIGKALLRIFAIKKIN